MALAVGALHPNKAHEFAIMAVGLVSERVRPELVIVFDRGDLAQVEALRRLAEQRGVSLTLRSAAPNEMADLYNQAALTLYPPVLEPLGLVSLESMACGTPVVGVREGGVRETVHDGVTGILTERDPEEFADAVESLMANEVRRRMLGEAGPDYVRTTWSWERSTETLLANMRRLIKNTGRGG
jgi:glycosyltransferase involved in cell wall biosynthesis